MLALKSFIDSVVTGSWPMAPALSPIERPSWDLLDGVSISGQVRQGVFHITYDCKISTFPPPRVELADAGRAGSVRSLCSSCSYSRALSGEVIRRLTLLSTLSGGALSSGFDTAIAELAGRCASDDALPPSVRSYAASVASELARQHPGVDCHRSALIRVAAQKAHTNRDAGAPRDAALHALAYWDNPRAQLRLGYRGDADVMIDAAIAGLCADVTPTVVALVLGDHCGLIDRDAATAWALASATGPDNVASTGGDVCTLLMVLPAWAAHLVVPDGAHMSVAPAVDGCDLGLAGQLFESGLSLADAIPASVVVQAA